MASEVSLNIKLPAIDKLIQGNKAVKKAIVENKLAKDTFKDVIPTLEDLHKDTAELESQISRIRPDLTKSVDEVTPETMVKIRLLDDELKKLYAVLDYMGLVPWHVTT